MKTVNAKNDLKSRQGTTMTDEPEAMIDTSKMSEGQRAALEMTESAWVIVALQKSFFTLSHLPHFLNLDAVCAIITSCNMCFIIQLYTKTLTTDLI